MIICDNFFHVKTFGAMVKDFISQCGVEGFKSSQLQPSLIRLIRLG
jgi:hypothetical protein